MREKESGEILEKVRFKRGRLMFLMFRAAYIRRSSSGCVLPAKMPRCESFRTPPLPE
jgi:hypothetical protein